MLTDVSKLGNAALEKIDVAEAYITNVSKVATASQKQQAAEIARAARANVEAAIADAKKPKTRTIKTRDNTDRFDTSSSFTIERQGEAIESEVEKLIRFVDTYTTREDIVVVPKQELLPNPFNAALAADNARLTGELAIERGEVKRLHADAIVATRKYNKLQTDLTKVRNEIHRLSGEKKAVTINLEAKTRESADKQKQIDALLLQINGDGSARNPGLVTKLRDANAEIARIEAERKRLEDRIGDEKTPGTLLNEIAAKTATITAKDADIVKIKTLLDRSIRQVQELNKRIGGPGIAGSLLDNESKLNDQIAHLNDQINGVGGYKETIDALKQNQTVLQTRIRDLTALEDQLRRDIAQLAIDNAIYARDNKRLEDSDAKQKQELQAALAEEKKARDALDQAKQEEQKAKFAEAKALSEKTTAEQKQVQIQRRLDRAEREVIRSREERDAALRAMQNANEALVKANNEKDAAEQKHLGEMKDMRDRLNNLSKNILSSFAERDRALAAETKANAERNAAQLGEANALAAEAKALTEKKEAEDRYAQVQASLGAAAQAAQQSAIAAAAAETKALAAGTAEAKAVAERDAAIAAEAATKNLMAINAQAAQNAIAAREQDFQREKTRLEDRVRQAESDVKSAEDSLRDINNKLHAADRTIATLTSEKEKLSAVILEKITEIQRNADLVRDAQHIAAITKERDTYKTRAVNTATKANKLGEEKKELEEKLNNAIKRADDLQKRIDSMGVAQAAVPPQPVAADQVEIQRLQNEKKQADEDKDKAERALNELRTATAAALAAQSARFEADLKDATDEKKRAIDALAETKNALVVKTAEKETVEGLIPRLNEEKDRLNTRIAGMQQQLDEAKENERKARADLQPTLDEIERISAELTNTKRQLVEETVAKMSAEAKLVELEQKEEGMTRASHVLGAKVTKLTQDNDALTKDNDALKILTEGLREQTALLGSKLLKNQKEMLTINEYKRDTTRRIDELNNKLLTQEQLYTKLKAQLEKEKEDAVKDAQHNQALAEADARSAMEFVELQRRQVEKVDEKLRNQKAGDMLSDLAAVNSDDVKMIDTNSRQDLADANELLKKTIGDMKDRQQAERDAAVDAVKRDYDRKMAAAKLEYEANELIMRGEIQIHTTQIDRLSKEAIEKQRQLDALTTSLSAANTSINALQQEAKEASTKTDTATAEEKDRMTAKIANLEKQLQEKMEEHDRLDEEFQRAKLDLQQATQALKTANEELGRSKLENTELKRENENLTRENKEQAEKIADLNQQIGILTQEILNIYDNVLKALSPVGHKKADLTDIEAVIADIKNLTQTKPIGNFGDQYNAVKKLHDDMVESIDKLRAQLESDAALSTSAAVTEKIRSVIPKMISKLYNESGLSTVLQSGYVPSLDAVERKLAEYENKKAPDDIAVRDDLNTLAAFMRSAETLDNSVILGDPSTIVDMKAIKDIRSRLEKLAEKAREAKDGNIPDNLGSYVADVEQTMRRLGDLPKKMEAKIAEQQNEFERATNSAMEAVYENAARRPAILRELEEVRRDVNKQSDDYRVMLDKGITALDEIKQLYEDDDVVRVLGQANIDRSYASEIKTAQDDVTNVVHSLSDIDREIGELKRDDTKYDAKYADLQKRKYDADRRLDAAKKKLYDANVKMANDYRGAVSKAMSKILGEKDQLTVNNNILSEKLEKTTKSVTDLTAKLTTSNDEKTRALAEAKQHSDRVADLSKQLDLMTTERDALKDQVKAANSKANVDELVAAANKAAEASIASMQLEVDKAKLERDEAQTELDLIKEENTQLADDNKRLGDLDTKIKESDARMKDMARDVDAMRERANKAEVEAKISKQNAEANKEVIDILTAELEKLTATDLTDNDKEKIRTVTDARLVEAERKYKVAQKRFDDLSSSPDVLRALENQLTEEKERNEDAKAKIASLQEEKEKTAEYIAKRNDLISAREKEIGELKIELERVKKEIENATATAATAAATAADKLAEEKKAKADAEAKSEKDVADIEAKRMALTNELSELKKKARAAQDLSEARKKYLEEIVKLFTKIEAVKTDDFNAMKSAIGYVKNNRPGIKTRYDETKDKIKNDQKDVEDLVVPDAVVKGGRQRYYGGYDSYSDDSSYAAAGVAGVAGTFAWFGFSGLLIFLLVMLIVWFAYQIYREQFADNDRKGRYHHRHIHRQHRMVV